MIAPFVLACTPVLAPAPQSSLTQLQTVSEPAYGIASTVSGDGNTLFWMQGNQLKHIDLTVVRNNELNGLSVDPLLRTTTLNTGCTSLLEDSAGQRLFIGAADFGLYMQDLSTTSASAPVAIDLNTGGRWIHDLVVDPTGTYLLAMFGGLDASQLRVYDISGTPALVNTLSLDVANGLIREGTGYAVDLHGPYAYLAMGRSGLARIRWNAVGPVLQQGYDPIPPIYANVPGRSVAFRVRDLDIEQDFLFAASNGSGVIRVDLSATGWPTGANATSYKPIHGPNATSTRHFPVRVAATYNTADAEIQVAVGTYPNPDLSHEWGPYNPAASFTSGLGNPYVEQGFVTQNGPVFAGTDEGLFLFTQGSTGVLQQRRARFVQGNSETRDWKTISVQFVPSTNDRVWVYGGDFYVWNSRRKTNGAFTPLLQSAEHKYVEFEPVYSGGKTSALDPNIILSGADGRGNPLPLYRAGDSAGTGQPELQIIPGTTDLPHRLGLLLQDSWVEGSTEWVPGPQGDSAASIGLFESWKFVELTTSGGNFSSWKENYLDFPDDPYDPTGPNGRSYATVAVDDRPNSELLACGRSSVRGAVALYMRSAVRNAMLAQPAGAHVSLQPISILDLAPELGGSTPTTDHHNLRMDFFDLGEGDVSQRFLMVAAGQDLSAIPGQTEKPKLVFFNVTSCTSPGNCNPASIGPPIVALGTGAEALSFGATTAVIGSRTYAFMGDVLGNLTAFDLTPLSSGNAPTVAGTFYVGDSILDGISAPIIDVVPREENVQGQKETVLYLAASREGIVRVLTTETSPGVVDMSELFPRINTPGQAATLTMNSMTLGGVQQDTMVVFDHGLYGIQLYTE